MEPIALPKFERRYKKFSRKLQERIKKKFVAVPVGGGQHVEIRAGSYFFKPSIL